MEVEQNAQVSPPPMEQTENKPVPVEKKGKDIWVILLNIFLALITIFLLAYVAYKNGYINIDNIFNTKEEGEEQSSEEENEDNNEATETEDEGDAEEEVVMETYEGDAFTATIPEGWSIVEFTDGDGSDMMVEGVTYIGLTGVKVFHGEDQILHVKAVPGIGFVGCPELPLFSDSSTAYQTEQEEINDEVQMEMELLDYTNADYSDFEWFGKDFRRVNTSFYYDTVPGNNFFEPQCERIAIGVPGFSFEDSDGYEGTAYFYEISEDASEEELETLDGILASMVSV